MNRGRDDDMDKLLPDDKLVKKSFPIVGMHCASCAKLIERTLRRTPGVLSAQVNYGSEQAVVEIDGDKAGDRDLEEAVEKAGYRAIFAEPVQPQGVPQAQHHPGGGKTAEEQKEEIKRQELKKLRTKVIFSSVLSVLIFVGSFPEWFKLLPKILSNPFVLLALSLPVQFWAGKEFFWLLGQGFGIELQVWTR